jgi:hypothetical protein
MTPLVIPAKAGIQSDSEPRTNAAWIPAFAGMTGEARLEP